MFKCLSLKSGDTILILASYWRSRLDELRKLDIQDSLVCQGCKQPVRVRAGRKRRWHFAHKHLHNCPYESSSPALIEARSVLYDWLVRLYGESAVDIEVPHSMPDLLRPIDAWVDTGKEACVFWLVENRMKPDLRDRVRDGLASLQVQFMYLLLSSMVRPAKDQVGAINLTTTEREFARTTDYDYIRHPLELPIGKTLHYLDVSDLAVITFRDLKCVHRPQVYQGRILVEGLDTLQMDLYRGTLIHQGEGAELGKIVVRQDHRRKKLEKSRKIFGELLDRMLPDPGKDQGEEAGISNKFEPSLPDRPSHSVSRENRELLNKSAVCMFCGQETEDWWYLDRASGRCKCRTCLRNGRSS